MKKLISSLFLGFMVGSIFAQTVLSYNGNHNYTLVERTNLRRYDNDKYTGLVNREVRSFITCENSRNGQFFYSGDFYVSEDTVHNQRAVFSGIHEAIPSSFTMDEKGKLTMQVDNGYPSFRSFPSFPRDSIKVGDTWKGDSFRAIDPLNNGVITRIPMTILYKFLGEETYNGVPVYKVSAEWATRYGMISYSDPSGDKNLKSAQGSHKAVIYVNKQTGSVVFMTDSVDEYFVYNDGKKVAYKGTILQFTEYPPSTDYDKVLPALKRIGAVAKVDGGKKSQSELDGKSGSLTGNDKTTGEDSSGGTGEKSDEKSESKSKNDSTPKGNSDDSKKDDESKSSKKTIAEVLPTQKDSDDLGENKITVEETDSGIKLAIHDLKFKADSSELLSGESKRLDEIAEILKLVPDAMLLVEGHTASTGNPKGEMNLSKERALSIAEELAKRGVNPDKFICKGLGATKPIASNTTSEGKAKNRRVEITILE